MFKEIVRIALTPRLQSLFGMKELILYSYAFCVVLGAILCCLGIQKHFKNSFHTTLSPMYYYGAFIAGFVGGKLFFFLEQPLIYWHNPDLIWQHISGGFVCYGSIIFIALFTILYAYRKDYPLFRFVDLVAWFATLPVLFGRIGCYLNGCCYGKPSNIVLGVRFPNLSENVHPTQLYEAGFMFLLFLFLDHLYKKKKADGVVFLSYLVLYAIARSIIEVWRNDQRGFIFNHHLSHAQFTAIITTLLSILLYIFFIKKPHLKKQIT